jgi:hypothetical protein
VKIKDYITPSILFSRPLINFILVLLAMSAAYFTTIGSIKIQLAEKAESVLVETLDKKLARLEVVITEGRVSKDEFFEFKNNIETRLNRIECYLMENGR